METLLTSNQIDSLTDYQITRKIIPATKKYIKSLGYEKLIHFQYIRGTYHFTNCSNYFMTAKGILEAATGLIFVEINPGAAKLKKDSQ